jgi:hypothetical protein
MFEKYSSIGVSSSSMPSCMCSKSPSRTACGARDVYVTPTATRNTSFEPMSQFTGNQSVLLPYKCHLKDKSKFNSLQCNENNMLAASWPFYKMMDGLNTEGGLPMVCIFVLSQGHSRSAAHENRISMTLRLDFYSPAAAAVYVENDGTSTRISNKVWNVVVYVDDPQLFIECVSWKKMILVGNGKRSKSSWKLCNGEMMRGL